MNHNYKTKEELLKAQSEGKRFNLNGSIMRWNFDEPVDCYTLVEDQSEPVSKQRKHADVIIAWANGEDVQVLVHFGATEKWTDAPVPHWNEDSKYRVKPKNSTKYYVCCGGATNESNEQNANVKMLFCGSTGNLLSVEKIK